MGAVRWRLLVVLPKRLVARSPSQEERVPLLVAVILRSMEVLARARAEAMSLQAGELEVAALTTIELVAKTNFDIKGTTTFVDSTSLTLAGTNIKVKDKGKNKEYDLLKFLADNSRRLSENDRRLEAIEKKAEEDDGPTTEELSSQIKELWEILQMMQKHYVKLMKKDASAQSQK